MTTNISNSTNCNCPKPSFCGLKVFGNGAEAFIKGKVAQEGQAAVNKAIETIDGFRDWGYVNINKTPKKDVFMLQGHSDDKAATVETAIKASEPLESLVAKIKFLADSNRTFK